MSVSHVFSVSEAEFEQQVIERSRTTPVLVDFWAAWCAPCKMLGPLLERLVERRDGAVLMAKVDLDTEPGLAQRYGISSIPTVIAFRDGKPLLDFVGLLSEAQLGEFLDRVVPSVEDKQAQEAATREATDPARAEKLYRQVLEVRPDHAAASVGLARLLIAAGKDTEASEQIDRLGIVGDLGNEVERLGAILWLRQQARDLGDEATLCEHHTQDPKNAVTLFELGSVVAGQGHYEEALPLLLQAATLDRKLAAAKVRETMVKVFQVIGIRSPLADEYRDKLASVLY